MVVGDLSMWTAFRAAQYGDIYLHAFSDWPAHQALVICATFAQDGFKGNFCSLAECAIQEEVSGWHPTIMYHHDLQMMVMIQPLKRTPSMWKELLTEGI
jgi:hypothetical protein